MKLTDSERAAAERLAAILRAERPALFSREEQDLSGPWRRRCDELLGADEDDPIRRAALRLIHGLRLDADEETKTSGGSSPSPDSIRNAAAPEDDLRRKLAEEIHPGRRFSRGRVFRKNEPMGG